MPNKCFVCKANANKAIAKPQVPMYDK